jgi:hypothetical protein
MEAKLVTGHSKGGKKKGERTMSMHIERAGNGVSVRVRKEAPEMSKSQMRAGMMPMSEEEPPMLFNRHEDMMKHVKDHFGDVLPETDNEENDKEMAKGGGKPGGASKAGGAGQGQAENEDETDEMD